MAKFPMTLGDP